MSPAKSVLLGLCAGLAVYAAAANIGGIFGGRDTGANITSTLVTSDLAPSANRVTDGANQSGTKLAQPGTELAPTPAQVGTTVAPVTPRLNVAQTQAPTTSAAPIVSSTPTPVVPHSNTPSPTHTASTSPQTPSPTASPATPTPTPAVSQTPTPPPPGLSHVVLNEIAWAGTASGSANNPSTSGSVDEWLELYNSGSGAQELEGWSLCADDIKIVTFGAPHRIEQGQFFLIERTDDTTISDIPADYAGSFGKSLVDAGLHVTLKNGACSAGEVIDEVGPGGWYAGATAGRLSMERISATTAGNEPSNWATWGTIPDSQGAVVSTGKDAGGNDVRGTPKFKNSVTP